MSQLDLELYALLERARQRMAHPPRWWTAEAKADAKALEQELYAAQEKLLPCEEGGTPCATC